MKREEAVEVEIDSKLLECVKVAAERQGVSAEAYISCIVSEYVRRKDKGDPSTPAYGLRSE